MITKIKTEEGYHWAIVLNEKTTLEEVALMTNGLVELMQTATAADTFCSAMSDYYYTLELLREMIFTSEQAFIYESTLKTEQKHS